MLKRSSVRLTFESIDGDRHATMIDQNICAPKRKAESKSRRAYLSTLGPARTLDWSPPSDVDSRPIHDATNGLDEADWLDFLRERPNNGIRVIFFFVGDVDGDADSSPDKGTSSMLTVADDSEALGIAVVLCPVPRMKSAKSDVF